MTQNSIFPTTNTLLIGADNIFIFYLSADYNKLADKAMIEISQGSRIAFTTEVSGRLYQDRIINGFSIKNYGPKETGTDKYVYELIYRLSESDSCHIAKTNQKTIIRLSLYKENKFITDTVIELAVSLLI